MNASTKCSDKTIRVLLVEDSEDDADLLILQLRRDGFNPQYEVVDSGEGLQAALDKQDWDIVISDYILPGFSGLETLHILQARRLDIPCLIVSGKIDEETAVTAMKGGARDYIMKDNLHRLGPAVRRELKEAVLRKERHQTEEKLKEAREQNLKMEMRLRKELELFNHRIIQAQEEERKLISRELHEDTAQILAILKLELESLLKSGEFCSPKNLEKLKFLIENTAHAMQDVRRYSYALRPSELDHLGLEATLDQLVEDTNELGDLNVEFWVSGKTRKLSDDLTLVLFRIAQEALANIRKHARAAKAILHVEFRPDKITLSIKDNGRGFNPDTVTNSATDKGGLGIIGMRERAKLIGAEFNIKSDKNCGTTVTVEVKQ